MPNEDEGASQEFELIGEGEQTDTRPSPDRIGDRGGVPGNVDPVSLFDRAISGTLEGILTQAESSRDSSQARRDTLELIKKHGIHEHRETIFKILDKAEAGGIKVRESELDKGKG